MRFNFNTSATLKRLGAYSGNKATYGTVSDITIRGFLNPIAPTFATQSMGISSQAYEFTTDGQKDIRVNDILVINSEEYFAKGVMRNTVGGLDILKVTMEKPAKN